MKNISFDNPYLLLLIIPLALAVLIPYLISVNKDNRALGWIISLGIHVTVVILVALALAGLSSTSVLTKTTVYVVADVSYSSERNLDEIDEYIEKIKDNLPENSNMGIVCFGRDSVVLTSAGRTVRSVKEAKVDDSATDIVSALNYTETLFKDDTLKRIVLITDGNDTVNENASSLALAVDRITENGIKIDTVFLDNSLKEGEVEVQLTDVEFPLTTYLGHASEAKFLIQSSGETNVMLELFSRPQVAEGEDEAEYERVGYTVVSAEQGLFTVRMALPSGESGRFEYRAVLTADEDISEHNNSRTFTQTVVGRTKVMLVTGEASDRAAIEVIYGSNADIDTYLINASNNKVPVTLEALIEYDEIIVSNVDIRDIRNVNAFVDSLDMAISQYGKSLFTFGDLRLQTNSEDAVFKKFQELLPVDYGNNNREGRLYTIVLDVSHSMFMASKFTIAKEAAIKLLSILGDDDYICLVTFSGEIKVQTPKKVKVARQELISYIDSLTTGHGTDIGLGLEEALKTIRALNLSENQVMLISDGFSFDSTRDAVEVATELFNTGTTVSAINTYIPSDGEGGRNTLRRIVNAGVGGNYYSISSPENVENVVFGTLANDVGDVIIERDANVNIVKYSDSAVNGISSLPKVSGYIISMEKYDATVVLTVTHQKAGGYTETVPLYAYRAHGNGRVASLTTKLSGGWTQYWSSEQKSTLITNVLNANTPRERLDYPFTINVERTDYSAYIEIVPSVLDPEAVVTLKILLPSGRSMTRRLAFDSQKFYHTLLTGEEGTYRIDFTYSYDDKEYTAQRVVDIPYLAEYNSFVSFDTSTVYEFMRGKGGIYEGEIPSLENEKSEIATYKLSFRIPLLIASIVLFLIDVLVRKLKLGARKKKKPRTA